MKKLLLLFFGIITCWATGFAQGTINTHAVYPDNNGSSAISFEIESTTPINITDIAHVFNAGTSSSDVWVRIGGIGTSSAPLGVTTGNGWVLDQTATVSGGGGASSAPVSLQNLVPISIPANTPVGIVITGGMRYSGTGAAPPSPTSFVDGPVTLRTGGTWGYGGVVPSLGNNPRGFLGTVTYELGIIGNCPAFTNFSTDSVNTVGIEVDWTPGSGNESFFMEYGPVGFTPGNGTSITGTYPGTQPPVYISGLNPDTGYDIYFGEICNSGSDSIYFGGPQTVTTNPTCFPIDPPLSLSAVTSNSAIISFTTGGSSNTFNYEVGPTGFTQGTGATGSGGNPLTVTGLNANQTYDVYVRNDCSGSGNGTSSWIGPLTFTTACLPVAAPWSENFDGSTWVSTTSFNGINDTIDNCWDRNNEPNLYSWTVRGPGTVSFATGPDGDNSGSGKYLMIEGSNGSANNVAELYTPLVDVSALARPELRFYFHTNVNAGDSIIVDVLDSSGTWNNHVIAIGQFQSAQTDPYEYATVDLDPYGDTVRVRFRSIKSTAFNGDMAIDDVSIDNAPLCAEPSFLTLSNVLSGSATIGFNSSGSTFNYEVGPTGFTQGTGTVGSGGNPVTVTGLSPNTTYDIYIQRDCSGAGNGTSLWVGPLTFTTLCAPLTAPYSYDFETATVGFWDGIDNCWTIISDNPGTTSSGGYSWEFRNTAQTTSGTSTGPDRDNTLAPATGGIFVTADVSGSASGTDSTMLISPLIDVSGLTTPELRFYYHKWGTNMPDLQVDVSDGTTWTNNYIVIPGVTNTSQSDPYILGKSVLSGFGDTVQVRFRIISQGCCAGDIGLDDFSVIEAPLCPEPTFLALNSVTSTSAVISFTAPGSTFNYEVGPTGFTQGTGVTGNGGNPLSLSGLMPNTTYDVYVQTDCSGSSSGTSVWVGPLTFTTACVPFTAPYSESFDGTTWVSTTNFNGVGDTIDNCWNRNNEPNLYSWTVRGPGTVSFTTGPAGDNSGSGKYVMIEGSNGSAGNTAELYTPLMDISALVRPELSFYFHTNVNPGDSIFVDVQDSSGTWNNKVLAIGPVQSAQTDAYEKASVDLSTYGDTVQARFRSVKSTAFNGDMAIDDVAFDDAPLCPEVSLVNINGVTSSAVFFGFNSANSSFNFEIGPTGFTQGTGTVSSGGNPGTVSGLMPNTTYDLYIQTDCSGAGNGTSIWIGPFTFTTLCAPLVAPYLEDFESFTVGFFDGIENCVAIDSDNPSTTPSGGYSWEVRNTAQTTSGTGTGPDRDNTLAPSIGGHFVTADVSGSAVGNETRLLTPLIDITGLTSPELEYYYHMHGTGMADLHVDIWDGSAWINDAHLITGTQNTSQSDPYNDTTLDLSTYNIDTIQVRFRLSSNGCCSGDVAIDDIRISDPPTCPDPSNLGAFNVLATTASIYWTSGGASHAIVEYGPVGFALGTGTKITTTNDTLNITGLSGATAYEFYVQDSCGAGDLSFQSGPFRFITACTVVGAPYTWDFESSTVGHWDGTDVCWDYASNNPGTTSSGGYSWEVRNTPQTTSGTGTGPDRDNTLAPATGGNFVTANVSGSVANTDSTLLMSPEIDVTSLNVPELKFYYHKWGTNMPDLHVDVYDGTWHRDYLVITGVTQTSQSDPYTEATADLSSLGDTVQVRFRIISLGCCQGDIAIDDFSIAEGPTCPKPTGFALTATTSSSATLGWNTSGNAQSYIIEYGPAGFTQGQGTITSSTTNSVTISGLTQNNVARDAYLRAFCGIGDSSIWVGPITFFPTPVPCDDIEAYNTGLIQGQSALFLGWGGAAGDAEVSTTQAVSGTQSLRIYDSGPTGASDVVAYFDTIDSGAWEVAFKMYIPAGFAGYYNIQQNHNVTNPVGPVNLWGGEVYFQANGTAEVQYSTGSVVAGTFTYTQGQWNDISTIIDLANDTIWYEYNGSSTGVGYQYSIANPGGPLQFNGVNFFSGVIAGSTDQADFYVDDFCITPYSANNCPAPTFLSATNITCTSADLAWTSIAGKQSLVEYGPAGFTLGTGTKLNYVTSPASVSSLLGNTAYDFYVADTCGADTSAWVKSSFTTANAPISASFTAAPGAPGPTSLTVSFNGSASIGANSYAWNFGDGSSGSGMNTTHDYTANGKYQVTLTVTGPCGTASFSDSVTIAGISIEENIISRSLAIYPNPSSGMVNISFDTESSDDVTLTVLDLSGKVVRMIKSSNVNGRYDDKLDISELARGSYLLKVESGDTRSIRRIVRE